MICQKLAKSEQVNTLQVWNVVISVLLQLNSFGNKQHD